MPIRKQLWRILVALVVCMLSASALTQEADFSPWPRPYVSGGLTLNGGGYSPAGTIGIGVMTESRPIIFDAQASVDNAHKLDSNTGSTRYLSGTTFYRLSRGYYLGGGARWSKLSTILYSKESWRPTFGGGKDWIRSDFSARTQFIYALPGTDRSNGVQGALLSLWLPSPKTKGHFFYVQHTGIYTFHQSASPLDPGTRYRHKMAVVDFTFMCRF